MRIATWNVNSIRQRIDHLLTWLKECSPDIACLQEIKCVDEAFPRLEIEALGYNVVTHGQKTFNGVALLSKLPFEETRSGLAGDDEDGQEQRDDEEEGDAAHHRRATMVRRRDRAGATIPAHARPDDGLPAHPRAPA